MSNPEDEYFARIEREQKEKLRANLTKEEAAAQREERRKLHHHCCGKCGAHMETKTFRGFEIEVCTECGAVLLDPGELEDLAGNDQSGVISGLFSMFGGGKDGKDE